MDTIKELWQIIGEIYIDADLSLRFGYTYWLLFGGLYFFSSYYEKLQKKVLESDRKKKMKNYRLNLYIWGFSAILIHHITQYNKAIIPIFNDNWITYMIVLAFIMLTFGLLLVGAGRAALNGYWGPHIYDYLNNKGVLVTKGIYSHLRHPIYFGQILLVFGTSILANNIYILFFPLFSTFFIILRAHNEEKDLELKYKDEFKVYKDKVDFMFYGLGG